MSDAWQERITEKEDAMKLMEKRSTFGVIVATRGFFNPRLASEGRKALLQKLDRLGFDYVLPAVDATPNGAIETLADARTCAALFREKSDVIDGILVVLPNFGDELGVVQTLDLAKLNVPVLVQACDDDLDKCDVKSRRDAFCGKLSVCNNLYQYGIPFTDTSLHTCRIDSEAFSKDLDFFARVCRVTRGLRNARIGAVGARPAAFQTVRYSEKILQSAGITVVPVDLSEIISRAQALADDTEETRNRITEIKAYGSIPDTIAEEKIVRQAKLCNAIEAWMEENECVASAMQCWTSIQQNYGCATCLSMSLMGERFMPSACEVDVTGVISMYTLLLASGNPPGFQDWNNNYGDDPDKCINVHCSNYPKSFIGREVEISNQDILSDVLGSEGCFGAVKGQVAAGPMTFFRMSTDDTRGKIRCYVGEGAFTDDPCGFDGGTAVCRIPNLRGLMRYLCKNGFEHHIALTREHHATVLEEAISTYLKWDLYRHEGE